MGTEHECWDDFPVNLDFSFEEFDFDYGNKPLTATVPGTCDYCGDEVTMTLEVTGLIDPDTGQSIYRVN